MNIREHLRITVVEAWKNYRN